MREKGLIDIYILEILERYSSEHNRLYQKDIMHYLDVEYHMSVNRNTLSGYLGELKEQNYIAGERGFYYVRRFSSAEIGILLNSIVSSKSIPSKDIQKIMEKIKSMAEPQVRKRFRSLYFMEEGNHTDNENVCAVIDILDEAIEKRCKVELTGCSYDLGGSLLETSKRIVDPYYIVAEKARYYLLCYAGREDIEPRRIDRIKTVKVQKEKRTEIDQIPLYRGRTFQVAEYMKEHIYMYSGSSESIKLKVKREHIGDFIDWFGKDFQVLEQGGNVTLRIRANTNAVYFWALQYGSIAEILKPESLRRKVHEGAMQIAEKHK